MSKRNFAGDLQRDVGAERHIVPECLPDVIPAEGVLLPSPTLTDPFARGDLRAGGGRERACVRGARSGLAALGSSPRVRRPKERGPFQAAPLPSGKRESWVEAISPFLDLLIERHRGVRRTGGGQAQLKDIPLQRDVPSKCRLCLCPIEYDAINAKVLFEELPEIVRDGISDCAIQASRTNTAFKNVPQPYARRGKNC